MEMSGLKARILRHEAALNYLQQTITVACDAPSNHSYYDLKKHVMPNLDFIARDTVHLCINYENLHGGKKTAGGEILQTIQNKFNQSEDAEPF